MALTKKEKDKRGAQLIVGVVIALLGFVALKFALDREPKPDRFGCVGEVTANTVIVVDATDKYSEQTRREISARALAFIQSDKVAPNERVTVFSVSEVSKQDLRPDFSYCKPTRDAKPIVESQRLQQRLYDQKFIKPLTQALEKAPVESRESPLAQALIDISLTQYLRGSKNTLLVFSDMLEHVNGKFSMYPPRVCQNQQATIKDFRAAKRGAQERPSFVNTAIHLNIIPRTGVPSTALACRDQLWPWFFGDNKGDGATLSPDYLPGA